MRGGSENSKFSQFQIFPKLGTRGGGRQITNFSQIQKSPNHPCGLFPLFVTFFNLMASLTLIVDHPIFRSLDNTYINISEREGLDKESYWIMTLWEKVELCWSRLELMEK